MKKEILNDYQEILDKDHVYIKINTNEILKKFKSKESFYLVMGFPKCPWCQKLMPVLNDVAKANNIKEIYYLDIMGPRDDITHAEYNIFQELTNTYFSNILDPDKSRVNAPTFIKVKNGDILMHHLNTVSTHTLNSLGILEDLTLEQKLELEEILTNFFN